LTLLDKLSKEQLDSLHQTCYLPLATASDDIVNNGVIGTTDNTRTDTNAIVDAKSDDIDAIHSNDDLEGRYDHGLKINK